jgi:hypothetical protein
LIVLPDSRELEPTANTLWWDGECAVLTSLVDFSHMPEDHHGIPAQTSIFSNRSMSF